MVSSAWWCLLAAPSYIFGFDPFLRNSTAIRPNSPTTENIMLKTKVSFEDNQRFRINSNVDDVGQTSTSADPMLRLALWLNPKPSTANT